MSGYQGLFLVRLSSGLVSSQLKKVIGISGYATTNFIFALCLLVSAYNFARATTLDPGYTPKLTSDAQTKEVRIDFQLALSHN